jgi:uncharacterized protein
MGGTPYGFGTSEEREREMRLEHEFTVPTGVEEVWRTLLDIERVAPCMPGASVTAVEGDSVEGVVRVKVGPVTLTYKGTAVFQERNAAAHRVVLAASGREARGQGTARATVTGTLTEHDGGTAVRVVTDLSVTGRPAQFGRGVMAEVSGRIIAQFADCLSQQFTTAPLTSGATRHTGEPSAWDVAGKHTHTGAPAHGGPSRHSRRVGQDAGPEPTAAPAERPAEAGQGGRETAMPLTGDRPEPEPIDLLRAAGVPGVKAAVAAGAAAVAIAAAAVVARKRHLVQRAVRHTPRRSTGPRRHRGTARRRARAK